MPTVKAVTTSLQKGTYKVGGCSEYGPGQVANASSTPANDFQVSPPAARRSRTHWFAPNFAQVDAGQTIPTIICPTGYQDKPTWGTIDQGDTMVRRGAAERVKYTRGG